MILSHRQYQILAWLARYKYVCVEQFHRHLFYRTTRRNAELALQKLENAKLLKRLLLPRGHGVSFGPICYLTPKGAQQLSEIDQNHFRPIHRPIQSLNHYAHRKQLVDFLIALDWSVAQVPNVDIKQHLTEFRTAASKSGKKVESMLFTGGVKVVPDAIFILQNRVTKKEAAYCVEIDTAKETIGRDTAFTNLDTILAKFSAYERLIESGEWRSQVNTKASAFEVLFVCQSETHVRSVLKTATLHLTHPEFFLGMWQNQEPYRNILLKPLWIKSLEMKLQPLLN